MSLGLSRTLVVAQDPHRPSEGVLLCFGYCYAGSRTDWPVAVWSQLSTINRALSTSVETGEDRGA